MDLAKIEDYLNKMNAAMSIDDSEKGEDMGTSFHYVIAEATHRVVAASFEHYIRQLS